VGGMVFDPTIFVRQRFQPQAGSLFTAVRIALGSNDARQGNFGNSSPMRAHQSQPTNCGNEDRDLGVQTNKHLGAISAYFKSSGEFHGYLMKRRGLEGRKAS
jgi:hypothetical protein